MFLKQLFESDNSFELVSPEKWDQEIVGVSTPSYLRANTLLFIKKKNFYKKIQEKQQDIPENVGIIFEKKLWGDLKEEADLRAFSYVGIADDLTMLMTTVSQILFAELNDGVDFFVDGRSKDKVTVGKNTLIGENVFLGENVVIGENVKIYPGAVVMPNVEIGDHCEIFSNVTIYGQTCIGKGCRIHAGTTIGSDGFGYNFYNGQHLKLWHSGGVIIEDGVEIGSNSCVDMGTFTPTIIRGGTKIDNQVQVAHNVELGQGVILCGQSGIAGSCTVGPYTVMGGQTGVSHDIHIGSQCQIGGFSAVTSNVTDGAKIAGFPARPFNEWLAGLAYVRRNSLKKR